MDASSLGQRPRATARFTRQLLRRRWRAAGARPTSSSASSIRPPVERFDLRTQCPTPVVVAALGRADRGRRGRRLSLAGRHAAAHPRGLAGVGPDVFFFAARFTPISAAPVQRRGGDGARRHRERFPELTLPTPAGPAGSGSSGWAGAPSGAAGAHGVSDFAAREIAGVLHIAPGRIRVAGEAPGAGISPALDSAGRHPLPPWPEQSACPGAGGSSMSGGSIPIGT